MQLDFSSSNGVPLTFKYILTLHFVLSFKFCADFFFFFTRTRNSKTFIFSTASVICCCRKKKMNKQQSLNGKRKFFWLHSNIFFLCPGQIFFKNYYFLHHSYRRVLQQPGEEGFVCLTTCAFHSFIYVVIYQLLCSYFECCRKSEYKFQKGNRNIK